MLNKNCLELIIYYIIFLYSLKINAHNNVLNICFPVAKYDTTYNNLVNMLFPILQIII